MLNPAGVYARHHIARLERRLAALEERVKVGVVRNLDDERAEVKTLKSVLALIKKSRG